MYLAIKVLARYEMFIFLGNQYSVEMVVKEWNERISQRWNEQQKSK